MDIPDTTASQTVVDKILWMLGGGGVVGGLVALANLILNRNKPKGEVAKLAADTSLTQTEVAVKLSNQLTVLHDKINLMEAGIDTRQQETANAIKLYQDEIASLKAERDLLQKQLDKHIRIGDDS